MKELTILFDVDGVLANFTSSVLDAIASTTGKRFAESDVNQWSYRAALRLSKSEWDGVVERIEAPGFAAALRPYDGAVEVVRNLAEKHDVVFATSPWRSSSTWTHDRDKWLVKHFGETLGSKVIHTSMKHMIGGDILVEDKPETLHEWGLPYGRWGGGFLVDRPYNRSSDSNRFQRIERLEQLNNFIAEWS